MCTDFVVTLKLGNVLFVAFNKNVKVCIARGISKILHSLHFIMMEKCY